MGDKPLIVAIIIYVYFHTICCQCWRGCVKPEPLSIKEQTVKIREEFVQIKDLVLKMYKNSMTNIISPTIKEERCFPLNGHIGSVINRAIDFCG